MHFCDLLLMPPAPMPLPSSALHSPHSPPQVLNGDRLPAYQYQDDPKATPSLKAVDLPASQFLANG